MRQSRLATKTRKEVPSDEIAKNAVSLIRAGYIHKTMAGVYSLLPLGLRSFNKIVEIVREEMNAIGGQEIAMNGLQNPEVWKKTGRWDGESDEVWFRTHLRAGGDLGLGWTHEEPITDMMRSHIHSYRDLPLSLYQFQTKFRNEERAKSGIMRTREFVMKDMYSFCRNEQEHKIFYEQCATAYMNIFARIGIGDDTYRVFASGGAFSEFSDEFQTVLPTGEDTVYIHKEKGIALNKEVYTDETIKKLGCTDREGFEEYSASEVGNIFTLGTRFSDALDLRFTDEDGSNKPIFMGCYGIGPGRVLGAVVEKCTTEGGMVLPVAIAPFAVHLVVLGESEGVRGGAEEIYQQMQGDGIDVLYDDRAVSAGEKFADSDLVGIPHRVIISEKTHSVGKVEYKNRMTGNETMVDLSARAIISAIQ